MKLYDEEHSIFTLGEISTICRAFEYFEIDGIEFSRGSDGYGVDVASLCFVDKIDCKPCYADLDFSLLSSVIHEICKLYSAYDKAGYWKLIDFVQASAKDLYVGGMEYYVSTAQIRDYLDAFKWCDINEIIIDTTHLGPVRFEIYFESNVLYDYEDEKSYCCYDFDEFMQFVDNLKGMYDDDDVESLWNFQYDLGC